MPRPIRPGTPGPTPVTPGTTSTTTPATTTPSTPARTGWGPGPTGTTTPVSDGFTTPSRTGTATSVKLGNDLFLSATGHFVTRQNQDKPMTAPELGEAMNRAAHQADDGVNVFKNPGVTLAQKTQALTALTQAFETGKDAAAFNGDKNQALQTRADAGPLVLDLISSLDASKPAEKALKDQAVAGYLKMLDSEPHGQLRTFMLYDLDRARPTLPEAVKPTVEKLMREVAPLAPPYEEWFKDGNTKLKLDYYVGGGFWEEETKAYEDKGFKRKDNADGTVSMTRHYANAQNEEFSAGAPDTVKTFLESLRAKNIAL